MILNYNISHQSGTGMFSNSLIISKISVYGRTVSLGCPEDTKFCANIFAPRPPWLVIPHLNSTGPGAGINLDLAIQASLTFLLNSSALYLRSSLAPSAPI